MKLFILQFAIRDFPGRIIYELADLWLPMDGYTLTEVTGTWKGEREISFKLEVVADHSEWPSVYNLATAIKNRFEQEAVLVQVLDADVVLV